jgi:hypothetical protein
MNSLSILMIFKIFICIGNCLSQGVLELSVFLGAEELLVVNSCTVRPVSLALKELELLNV